MSHLSYLLVIGTFWMGRAQWTAGNIFNRWDTGHYLRIAEHGYGKIYEDAAFFPLYPILIRAVESVTPFGFLGSALVVSNLACLGFLIILYRLMSSEIGDSTAERMLYALVAFPTAFFLNVGYNESLFMLLVTAALYCVRKGLWWHAGALGALTSATRSAGVLLGLAFAYEYLRQRGWNLRRIRADVLAAGLIPAGLVAYIAYTWVRFDDPLRFSHAQDTWNRSLSWPWESSWYILRRLLTDPFPYQTTVYNVLDLVTALGSVTLLALCVWGPWKLRRDQMYLVVYGAASLFLVLVFPVGPPMPLQSVTRYALEIIPVFIIMARMGSSIHLSRAYLFVALPIQTLLTALFLNYLWAG